jgi:hypothetical protein
MQRLTKIALVLALPGALTACADDQDNETNASGEDETGGTSMTSAPTGGGTMTTDPMTDTNPPTTGETEDPSESTGIPEGCVNGDDPASPRMELGAEITSDTTLTCDTIWVLTQATFVRGAVLTVDPGTTVIGAAGSALVIDSDARLEAVGTANAPIVFTSAQPVGSRARADWGGLVLVGLGINNAPNGVGEAEGFAEPIAYGGNDGAHNCGTMQYVRVEWAGFELVTDNELNGITWYTCGSGTTVDHVQSHMGSDDAFEWFGGAFDAQYLVATGMGDDSLDTDFGFTGTLQYVFAHQDPTEADGNHGIEAANNPDDFAAEPVAQPRVANMTFIGQGAGGNAEKSIGFVVKEGSGLEIYNSYFTGASGPGATFQDEPTIGVAEGGGVVIQGTIFGTHGGFGHQGDGPYTWTDEDWGTFIMDQMGNQDGVDLGLDATWTAPSIQPATGSPAEGAGVSLPNGFEATTYAGAVDPAGEDWTQAGWINYAVQ